MKPALPIIPFQRAPQIGNVIRVYDHFGNYRYTCKVIGYGLKRKTIQVDRTDTNVNFEAVQAVKIPRTEFRIIDYFFEEKRIIIAKNS